MESSVSAASAGPINSEVIPGKSQFGNRYSREYKLRILALADQCTQPGDMGRLLRKEGLLHTTLTSFRRQRAAGQLDSPEPVRKTKQQQAESAEQVRLVMRLERENRRLRQKLDQAEAIIEVQKKVSRLLEISLAEPENRGSGS
jgi:transposase-like protein